MRSPFTVPEAAVHGAAARLAQPPMPPQPATARRPLRIEATPTPTLRCTAVLNLFGSALLWRCDREEGHPGSHTMTLLDSRYMLPAGVTRIRMRWDTE